MRMLYIIYSIVVTTVVTGINLPGTGGSGGTTTRGWGGSSYSGGSNSGGSYHK